MKYVGICCCVVVSILFPMACLFLLTKISYWLQVSVLTMGTFIVEDRLQLSLIGVLLHGAAIVILFYLLFLTHSAPLLFIGICALSATAIIWLSTQGEQLDSLGAWTFIPAIIISIELTSEIKNNSLEFSLTLLPYFLVALLPTCIICLFDRMKVSEKFNGLKLSYRTDFGKKTKNNDAMLAMAIGIIISSQLG